MMPTIIVHPEHVDGLRYIVQVHLEHACEEVAVDKLRELLAVGDQLGWKGPQPWAHEPAEVRLPAKLLEDFLTYAWEAGNEQLGDIYSHRANPARGLLTDPERDEREARSMLAWHEHVQGQKVAS